MAGEGFGGVRPSSGAATLESEEDAAGSGASGYSVLAAPEDGRTPSTCLPASLTHSEECQAAAQGDFRSRSYSGSGGLDCSERKEAGAEIVNGYMSVF
jgi:hypothetical protein